MTSRIIIYAPNLHTGGGLVVLQDLISSMPKNVSCKYYLDIRSKVLNLHHAADVVWVKPSFLSRFKSELDLFLSSTNEDATLLLHSLPPIFFTRGKRILYLHNKLLLNSYFQFFKFPIRVALRIFIERIILRLFISRVDEVLVQTFSMKLLFLERFPSVIKQISVLPFLKHNNGIVDDLDKKSHFDFIYVASSEQHKNHLNLFKALVLLKKEGLNFSLAVTIPSSDKRMLGIIQNYVNRYSIDIVNIGVLSRSSIYEAYRHSGALIYPSTEESFGLPLVEAQMLGLPIIASELDYVRDICFPKETFDPSSPLSISRAIIRFCKADVGQNVFILDSADFVNEFMRKVNYCE